MRLALLLALGGLVATDALAKPPPAPAPAAPAPAPAPSAPSQKEHDKAFEAYTAAAGDHAKAASALFELISDPSKSVFHGEAWAKLGDELSALELPAAALYAYTKGIELDPIAGAPTVPAALALVARVGDDRRLAAALSHDVSIPVDPSVKSDVAYLAARAQFQNGQPAAALGILYLVDPASKVGPKAQNLQGVILTNEGRATEGLAPLEEALKGIGRVDDPRGFRNAVMLNLGRAYYAAGNFPRALESDAQVERESELWPEAHFERAWAHFRLDDMQGTLGLLFDQQGPFLDGYWVPEGDLLRVYAEFTLCKFPAARTDIDAFATKWQPRLDELDKGLAGMTEADAFADVKMRRDGGSTRIPAAMLRHWDHEDRMDDAFRTIAAINADVDKLGSRSGDAFATPLSGLLQAWKGEIQTTEGARVLNAVKADRDELQGMLGNVAITRLDIMQMETMLLEQASVTGKLDYGDRIGQLRKLRKDPKTRVWPFEGEYWADEMGWYSYELRSDCPTSLLQ